jgi:hypothetical protein
MMSARITRFILTLLLLGVVPAFAQSWQVNLAPLDGIELKPDNIFNYQVMNNSGKAQRVKLTGTVIFRQQQLRFGYQTTVNVPPGMNQLSQLLPQPTWNFSSTGLRELFQQYGKLPQGTYEYCVSLQPVLQGGEQADGPVTDECLFQTVNDVFLISLADPEDGDKLLETHPNFNWTVNYPFASQLTYRLRVAPMQKGQNKTNAIMRNPAIYTEKNITGMAKMYPATARELEKFKPYAWTVDAYYKDVLLGGAEPWEFMIVEDTIPEVKSFMTSHYAFADHIGENLLYISGNLKLRYFSRTPAETLEIIVVDAKGKTIAQTQKTLPVNLGENYFELDYSANESFRHKQLYEAQIRSGEQLYRVAFRYYNPQFVK